MAKFEFEITRRVAITFQLTVTAKSEEEAEEKANQMIADNDKKLHMNEVQVIVGGDWECTEDDIDVELL